LAQALWARTIFWFSRGPFPCTLAEMGCATSLAVGEDVEHTRARNLLQDYRNQKACGLLQDGKRGDFDAAFSMGRVLGKGGFSQVRAARRRCDGERLAVKVVTLRHGHDSAVDDLFANNGGNSRSEKEMQLEEVVGELAAWSAVQGSRHVVGLVSAMVVRRSVFMVMERCETSILGKVSESPRFWPLESQRVLKEMLLGVQACHQADIVHRDIKPQNFLLGADGSTVKLCDFGLAVKMPRRGKLGGMAGTLPFSSPEMLKGSGYGKATDMWSFGVMAYYLSFGHLPFRPNKVTCEGMSKATQNGLSWHCRSCLERGGAVGDLVRWQLELRPAARCSVEEALAHAHLQESAVSVQASKKLISGSHFASEAPRHGGDGAETPSTSTGCSTPDTVEWAPASLAARALATPRGPRAPAEFADTGTRSLDPLEDGPLCI